jgi:hypothetical protein
MVSLLIPFKESPQFEEVTSLTSDGAMILTVVSDWSVYSFPDPTLTPYRDSWLPLSMSDPASFYEVLGQIALHVVSLRKEVGCVRSLASFPCD